MFNFRGVEIAVVFHAPTAGLHGPLVGARCLGPSDATDTSRWQRNICECFVCKHFKKYVKTMAVLQKLLKQIHEVPVKNDECLRDFGGGSPFFLLDIPTFPTFS